MPETKFQENLKSIIRYDPSLAERISDYLKLHPLSSSVNREKFPTDKSSKADRMQDLGYLKSSNLIIVYGLGDNNQINDIVESTHKGAFILVIEPDLSSFVKYLNYIDLTISLGSGRVKLSVQEDPATAIQNNIENYIGVTTISDFCVIKDPASINRAPDYFNKTDLALNELKKTATLNRSTIEEFSLIWQRHIFLNLKYIVSNPGIRELFGKFKNIPALIISAGPSLDKNVKWLNRFKESCLIIAVDSASRTLKENGISPHFVLSLDPKKENFPHMEGLDLKQTTLIMNPVTYPSIPKDYAGPIMNMTFGDPLTSWIEESIGKLGETLSGGSVSTSALDLAVKMGCSPIVLVGQDLSYESKRSYASSSYYSLDWQDSIVCRTSLQILNNLYIQSNQTESSGNIFGVKTPTNGKMVSWLRWIETMGGGEDRFNATEGGLQIAGYKNIPLHKLVRQYSERSYPVKDLLNRILSNAQKIKIEGLRKRLCDYLENLKEVKKIANEGKEIALKFAQIVSTGKENFETNHYVQRLNMLSADIMEAKEFMRINEWDIDSLLRKITERQNANSSNEIRNNKQVIKIKIDTYQFLFTEINRITEWGICQVLEGLKGLELIRK